MKLLSLRYRRPKKVDSETYRQRRESAEEAEGSVKSGVSGASSGIPDALSFDRIINGGTCPPLAIRDFMNYLVYVEHAAENLQFYLWYKDYEKRFAEAKPSDVALAPEWTQAMEDEAVARVRKDQVDKMKREPATVTAVFKGTDFEKQTGDKKSNPFNTPPRSANGISDNDSLTASWEVMTSGGASNNQPASNPSSRTQATDAFQSAGARLPFTIQPFHQEVNRIITSYIMEGAPRQLNLAAWEQRATVQALSYTTHPSAFRILFKSVDSALRLQSHPNFIRWSICNGNLPRVWFARALGISLIIAGFVSAIILALSKAGRGYRALPLIAWVLGMSTFVAAYKGMCVVLHGLHHRHVRPWELFTIDDGEDGEEFGMSCMKSFGSNNSYEDEPWVVKYQERNIIRKIFDREIWIQEPALRQIQDTIFCQALMAGFAFGLVFMGIFLAVPGGHFF
ncbi:regulator of g signaling superfamily [Trichoderma arundinaceum]|uniref:Regulator of g signaling superfamily n=1 Tax=Trichoderma arundinaceum TaxID=490622 RepID=A0A395N8H8_TRIAR|nr:regulator of g signaling superfamily [Trichoderma arundinaceum]